MNNRQPSLLLMKGPPGSGKSTIARQDGRQLGWPVVDKDDVRDLLPDELGGISYEAMLSVARRQLLLGLSVIADSPLGYARSYRRALEIASEAGAFVAIIECRCSDLAAWKSRILERQGTNLAAHHTTDWTRVEDFFKRSSREPFEITVPHLFVDTAADSESNVNVVLQWIRIHQEEPIVASER